MKPFIKKIDVRDRFTKVTLEHNSTFKSLDNLNNVLSIGILFGCYNQFGRKIDVDKYKAIQTKFENCINEIQNLL